MGHVLNKIENVGFCNTGGFGSSLSVTHVPFGPFILTDFCINTRYEYQKCFDSEFCFAMNYVSRCELHETHLRPSSAATDILILFETNMSCRRTFLTKIRPVAVEMFHADGRTDRRTNMTNLTVVFRSFANVPNEKKNYNGSLELYERVCEARKLTGLLVKTLYVQHMYCTAERRKL
jgi:hypothetical protein